MCEKNKRVQEKLYQRAVNQLIQYVQLFIHNVKSKLLKFKTGLQSIYDNLRDLKINVDYA
jgi:hypothetical protein